MKKLTRELIGKTVVDIAGTNIGVLKNIVFDTNSGCVEYLIVLPPETEDDEDYYVEIRKEIQRITKVIIVN